MDNQNIELFRFDNYSFRMMTQNHKQQALQLLIEEFHEQEPLSIAYGNRLPQLKNVGKQEWKRFWSFMIDDCINCRMSLVIVDVNTNAVIGATAAKDLNGNPVNFEQEFMSNLNFFSSVISLQEEMIKRVKVDPQDLLRKTGTVMDIWGVALRKQHMGKKLLHKMIAGNNILANKQGFSYSFVYATNFKTGIALAKQNYQKLDEIESRQFQYRGVTPFCKAEEINSKASIWLKKLK